MQVEVEPLGWGVRERCCGAHLMVRTRSSDDGFDACDERGRRLQVPTVGIDRLAGLRTALATARRGGTVCVVGVYGGAADPIDLMSVFDRQLTLRFGQANVRRWIDALLPLVSDPADPLDVLGLRTHRLALEDAPRAYEMFQSKSDGCIKVVLDPAA